MVSREPGGWGTLDYEFNAFGGAVSPRLVSWLLSAVRNGRVFRLPIVISPQLVSAEALGVSASTEWEGLPWANDQPWSNGKNWDFSPVAPVAASGLAGSTTLSIDLGAFGQVLWNGHVIGEGDHAYWVDDVSYAGSVATVTVSPPLRRDVTTSSLIKFRPIMTGLCTAPETFESMFEPAGIVRPGAVRFTEVVL